jgi:hypothetical protein
LGKKETLRKNVFSSCNKVENVVTANKVRPAQVKVSYVEGHQLTIKVENNGTELTELPCCPTAFPRQTFSGNISQVLLFLSIFHLFLSFIHCKI